MKHRLTCASVCLVAMGWVASCATTGGVEPAEPDAGALPPRVIADAAAEASCEGDACILPPAPCTPDALCAAPAPVSGLYALSAVWGSSPTDVWAVGSGGTIIHWDGTAWVATPSNTLNTLFAVSGSGPNDVWAVSATDSVFHSAGFANGTAAWEREIPVAPTKDTFSSQLNALSVTAPGQVLAAGKSRQVAPDDPDSFESINLNTLSRTGEGAWSALLGTATVQGMWARSSNEVWLVGDNSRFVEWELGWTARGLLDATGTLSFQVVESLSSVVLRSVWGIGDELWAVGDNGQIRRYRDGSTRWEVVPSPTLASLVSVYGRSPSDVWAVGARGTVLHYDGVAWQPVLAVFADPSRPPNLSGVWVAGSGEVWIVGDGVLVHRGVSP